MAVASIVDYLKSRGMDSSYSARKNLASQYGITGYSGTANQNTSLLKSLQQGQPAGQSANQNNAGSQSNATNNQNVTITPVDDSKAGHPAATYLTDYSYQRFSPSTKTQDYADRLDEIENNKPDDYSSKYQGRIDNIINGILNRESFKTDDVYNSDLYKTYRDQYIQQGQKAMRDTMGAAQAATGGYGSTYAQAAGQQAYDSYLSQLGDKTLDIYDRVYNQYLNEGQEMYNKLNAVNNQDNIDYSRYRDSVNDYYNDLNYYAGRYDNSYNQDFGEYQTDLSAKQWAEQYAYQKTQDALAQQNWQTQFDYQKQQDALQLELQRQQLAASLARKSSGGSSGGTSKKSSSGLSKNDYLDKAKMMLSGTDGSDTHKYQEKTVSRYLSKQYGLSSDEADLITSKAKLDIQSSNDKNIDKYYKYTKDYASGHTDEETFDYLNKLYETNKIDADQADEIYTRLGLKK